MSFGATGRGDVNQVCIVDKARLLAGAYAAALALAALTAGPAAAQTWTGTTSNDWTVGTNWVG